ncbi:MAG: hypothetical protein QGG39_13955, partial [Candidatus Poribacteria bacterium]|nr:hypothetical protein [Candidatus Poribacteria bacterium]
SAQSVDQPVVQVRTDCYRFYQQSKAVSTPLALVKPTLPRPRSLPEVKPNKGSLRQEYPCRLPPPSARYLGRLWFFRRQASFFGRSQATVDQGFFPLDQRGPHL